MIELNSKTQQDFLNREWVQRLLDAGVDMSDAKYYIGNWTGGGETQNKDIVFDKYKTKFVDMEGKKVIHWRIAFKDVIPTYTVSELLYKLHEWIYPTIDGKEFSGGLRFIKDAPFYIFYYNLRNSEVGCNDEYIFAEHEYPIESLASLLLQCHKKDIGIKNKEGKQISDTGNISDK